MSFRLNDVASSSSSSDEPSAPSDGGSDREVDESLARDVRSALHLAVGKICRAEDSAAREAAGGHNGVGSDAERSAFATSREAIAALTDLAYHHATTLMANDLVAFSKHARRRTVKTDDVLLLARKDRRGVLADLKRTVEEDPERYSEATKGVRARSRSADARGGGAAARKKPATKSSSSRRRSKSNGGRRSKSKPKAKGKKAKEILPPPSSSSSASSGSEDSDDENDELKTRRKKLDEERRLAHMKKSSLSTNATDDGSDLASFIATDGTEEDGSSVDVEFDISAAVSKMGAGRNGGPGNGCDRSDSDECVAELVGGKGEAAGEGEADDAMAIDLTADD